MLASVHAFSRAETLVPYLTDAAATLARTAQGLVKRVDAKAVHAARVATRRTQAVLWLVGRAEPPLAFPELDAALKTLARALGARRDIDVAIELDATLAKDLHLRRRRKEATTALSSVAAGWDSLRAMLDRAVAAVTRAEAMDLAPACQRLRKKLRRWRKHPPHDSKSIHEMRKSLKRTRYILEALHLEAEPLVGVQQELGKMHDAEVLMELRGETTDLRRIAKRHEKRGLKKSRKALKHARKTLARPG